MTMNLGWHGGYALMQERGYHVEAVYDIRDDFIYHMEDEDKPLLNPSKYFPEFQWSSSRAPEGLHPARLARTVIHEFLSSTGTQVPWKTHEPLTFSGFRSTVGHEDQSIITLLYRHAFVCSRHL